MKKTKRKGFNFMRSYFDVYNLLEDKDKIEFINALLDRQFLGVTPIDLSPMANFAYTSQVHNIDSQVKGYNDRMISLNRPVLGSSQTHTEGVEKSSQTPPQQEKEKEQEQEQEKEKEKEKEKEGKKKEELFLVWWDLYGKKIGQAKCNAKFRKLSIANIEKCIKVTPSYVKATPNDKFRKNPYTWLNGEHWNDEIAKPKPEDSVIRF